MTGRDRQKAWTEDLKCRRSLPLTDFYFFLAFQTLTFMKLRVKTQVLAINEENCNFGFALKVILKKKPFHTIKFCIFLVGQVTCLVLVVCLIVYLRTCSSCSNSHMRMRMRVRVCVHGVYFMGWRRGCTKSD